MYQKDKLKNDINTEIATVHIIHVKECYLQRE